MEIKESGEVKDCDTFGPTYNPFGVSNIHKHVDRVKGQLSPSLRSSKVKVDKIQFLQKQSAEGEEAGKLGEMDSRTGKPEAWPKDGPDCEADHIASYGVLNSIDLG